MIIAGRCGQALELRADLREQRFGEREGLTWAQAVARWGDDLRVGAGRVPGEERGDQFRQRVTGEFLLLARRHRDDVAVCAAHGGTVLAVLAHVLGMAAE